MAISGERAWKNTRKRSLYVMNALLCVFWLLVVVCNSNKCSPKVEEGYAGFIFYRKSKAPRDREVQPTSPPTAVDATAHHISVEVC